MPDLVCKRIVYQGQVQGVGFRYRTLQLSHAFRIGGTVKNLPSGEVEIVVQGETHEVETFLAAVRKQMGVYIESEKESPHAIEPFDGFRICR